MEKKPRRRIAWKVAMAVFGIFLASVAFIFWDAHRGATATFERFEKKSAEIVSRLCARPEKRPTFFGDPLPGNAWDLYLPALYAIEAIPSCESDVVPLINEEVGGEEPPDYPAIQAFYVKYSSLIDPLRQALRCEVVMPAHAYEVNDQSIGDNLGALIKTSKFLSGAAYNLADAGRAGEGFDVLAIVLGMAHDAGRHGYVIQALVQILCEEIGTDIWRDLLSIYELTPAELSRLVVLLDGLDGGRPGMGRAFEAEEYYVYRTLLRPFERADHSESILGQGITSWRTLWSERISRAEALNATEGIFKSCHALGRTSPLERAAATNQLVKETESHPNGIIRFMYPMLVGSFKREAEARMRWTLMRVATAIAWHQAEKGRFPAALTDLVPKYVDSIPNCPYTGLPLGYRDGSVWSYGGDGDDDGGQGLDVELSGDIEANGDVVWTVKRKEK